jgi:hypothetical protein
MSVDPDKVSPLVKGGQIVDLFLGIIVRTPSPFVSGLSRICEQVDLNNTLTVSMIRYSQCRSQNFPLCLAL